MSIAAAARLGLAAALADNGEPEPARRQLAQADRLAAQVREPETACASAGWRARWPGAAAEAALPSAASAGRL